MHDILKVSKKFYFSRFVRIIFFHIFFSSSNSNRKYVKYLNDRRIIFLTRNGIVQELVKSRAIRTFTIFLLLFPLPDGRQLSTKSYLLLPNGLCTLKMLGGCLSPLANLLPYCHESHPWKSLSLSSISFFLPRSFTRSPSPFATELLPFSSYLSPSPSCHVAIFHRTRNGLS